MKKKITILMLLMSALGLSGYAQLFAFEDALQLSKSISIDAPKFASHGKEIEYVKILRNYHKDNSKTVGQFNRSFELNPFLDTLMPKGSGQSPDPTQIPDPQSPTNFASFGGTNVTMLADGLAKFLAERTKEELEVMFFSRMKEYLDEHKENFGILLPRTSETFSIIDEKIYDFKKYINMIREAFHSDMRSLPENLAHFLAGSSSSDVLGEASPMIAISYEIGAAIVNGGHPGELLHKLSSDGELVKIKVPNLGASVSLLDFLSQSLRSKEGEKYWVSSDRVLKADLLVWKIYLGLLYEQSLSEKSLKDEIRFVSKKGEISLRAVLDTIASKPITENISFVKKISSLARTTERIQGLLGEIADDKKLLVNDTRFLSLAAGSLDLLKHADDILELATDSVSEWDMGRIASKANNVLQLARDIHEGHYSAAVGSLALLFSNVVEKSDSNSNFVNALLEYGGFLALITEAESSDQINDAIKMYALPAGSSRIKKESGFNIALQSYVGASFQTEQDKDNLTLIGGIAGFTAPVGISFSAGLGRGECTSSISLFVSAVDIGSLVQFRLVDDSSTVAQDISLANIFSPGIGFAYGFPKVPISIGGTYSAGPLLSKIVDDGQNLDVASNRKWGCRLFVALDIPILNFYNVSRKMKE